MMRLCEFLDMWTRKNRTLIICEYRYYDEMFDLIDEVNEGGKGLHDIIEYTTAAIIPELSQYKESYYIKEKLSNAEVTYFFIHDTFVIVWIRGVNNNA